MSFSRIAVLERAKSKQAELLMNSSGATGVAMNQEGARLNDERNPSLADRIDALHREGRRVFAAVGSLHMAGPQALPALMRARGYQVERIPFAP